MTEKLVVCVKCGKPIEQPRTGRPRLYCGDVCRQAAAFELRRVTRLLGSLEAEASYYRSLPDDRTTAVLHGTAWKDRLRQTEARIVEGERRLRVLLGKPRGTPLGVPASSQRHPLRTAQTQ